MSTDSSRSLCRYNGSASIAPNETTLKKNSPIDDADTARRASTRTSTSVAPVA